MKQVLSGVHSWARWNEERRLDFNGWHLDVGGTGVAAGAVLVVDPPPADAPTLAELERLGRPELIVLTNKDHTRGCRALAERFGAPVAIHAADAPLCGVPVERTFEDGELLPGGWRVVQVADAKSPGECALHHAGRRLLVVGDAVIGDPPGALRLVPAAKLRDPAAARRGLRRLLELDFDALLVGDGVSILSGARAALQAFVEG